jgi:hypothetical protein
MKLSPIFATQLALSLSLLAGLGACGNAESEPSGKTQAQTNSLWCKAKEVLDSRCVECHDGQGSGGSPMGLTSYDDVIAKAPSNPKKKVWERVDVRVHADQAKAEGLGPMPPKGDLSDDDLATLDAWLAAGAPQGPDAECAGNPTADAGADESDFPEGQCDAVYTMLANDGKSGKFQVEVGETHPKVYFDAPWGDEQVQAIDFKPISDNKKVLHHWILYGAAQGVLNLGGFGQGPFLTGWAPGDDANKALPDNVGMAMPTGAQSMYLDLHYYNVSDGAKPELDASGVKVCVVKKPHFRPNSSAVFTNFANIVNLQIPPQVKNYDVTGDCVVVAPKPVHLLNASPHAHRHAVHMKFTVKKMDGSEIVMHDHDFQFGEQASYPLTPEVVLETGDVVTTTCTFDNDSDQTVTFGESTDTEMCFNFAGYYPANGLSCRLF